MSGTSLAYYSDNNVTIMLEEWNLHESRNINSGIRIPPGSDTGLTPSISFIRKGPIQRGENFRDLFPSTEIDFLKS